MSFLQKIVIVGAVILLLASLPVVLSWYFDKTEKSNDASVLIETSSGE